MSRRRGRNRARRGPQNAVYESGSTGTRRSLGWNAPTTSPNRAVLDNLITLRDRSRDAARNDGLSLIHI